MLLIFPSIEISHKCCLEVVHGVPGNERTYSVDPVQMAVLWRGENAKTLHVIDIDGINEGRVANEDIIRRMVESVDIPIQLGGGLRSYEEIERVLSLGVYRVIVGTIAVEKPELIERLVKDFGTRKIAIAIYERDGLVYVDGGTRPTGVRSLDLACDMKKLGVTRIVLAGRASDSDQEVLLLDSLREMAVRTNIRISCWGGVTSYRDLMQLQSLEKYGVDSVIVGRPLYENQFPCQALWRLNEQHLTDLGPTRRI
jgi:phosphoribosylformimino-5-aminoimidazole carboxamide ribotide isomerase